MYMNYNKNVKSKNKVSKHQPKEKKLYYVQGNESAEFTPTSQTAGESKNSEKFEISSSLIESDQPQ